MKKKGDLVINEEAGEEIDAGDNWAIEIFQSK